MKTEVCVALLAIASVVSGCSSGTPLREADRARLVAEPQVILAHRPPRLSLSVFTDETTSAERWGAAFGPAGLGVGVMKSMSDAQKLGARFIGAFGLTDPVTTVEERFMSAAATHGLGAVRAVAEPVPSADGPELRQRFGDSTVLVLRTYAWLIARGRDAHRYATLYRAEASLVRGRDGVAVWSATCPAQAPGFADPATQPTLAELTANGGELLRARFAERASACADYLLDLFFGHHGPAG